MRRIVFSAGLALALCAPASAAAQGQLVDRINVPAVSSPTDADFANGTTQLQEGATYRLVITGSLRYEDANGESERWDPAYCIESNRRDCLSPRPQANLIFRQGNTIFKINPATRTCRGNAAPNQGWPAFQSSQQYERMHTACGNGPMGVVLNAEGHTGWTLSMVLEVYLVSGPAGQPAAPPSAPPAPSAQPAPSGGAAPQGFLDIARSQRALSRGSISLAAECPVDCLVEGEARFAGRVVGGFDTRLDAGVARSLRLRLTRTGRRLLRRRYRATGRAPVVRVVLTLLATSGDLGEQTIRTTVRVR